MHIYGEVNIPNLDTFAVGKSSWNQDCVEGYETYGGSIYVRVICIIWGESKCTCTLCTQAYEYRHAVFVH